MTARLIVISGLPGVGKTSVAEIVAARTDSVHLSIDEIEESLLGSGMSAGWQTGVAAYEAARAMAGVNLRAGRSVVVDAVNDSDPARQTWRTAASATGADLRFVHLDIADSREHERRLRDRRRGFAHVAEPTWSEVQHRRAEYADWADDVLKLDTSARGVAEVADAVIGAIDECTVVRKVVAYVIHEQRLLVFTHDDVPIEVAGVQVPAGSIEPGEEPGSAAVREVREETGLRAHVVRSLGVERYDVRPSKTQVHERHFFELQLLDEQAPERWGAGEDDPSDGGAPQRWTCYWIPLRDAHVLAAGFGARLGSVRAAQA